MRPHPDVAVTATALVGVAALHVASLLLAPPVVSLADAPFRAGARIAVEALVLDVAHGPRGRSLTLAQEGQRLLALAPPGDGPARGDLVRAVGVSDGDKLSADELTVLAPAATRAIDPADLARAPRDFEGARVLVRGEVRNAALAGGGARVALAGEPPPDPGGVWLATGTFRYHAADASYQLAVESWTRPS
jgi:hypothetical protein